MKALIIKSAIFFNLIFWGIQLLGQVEDFDWSLATRPPLNKHYDKGQTLNIDLVMEPAGLITWRHCMTASGCSPAFTDFVHDTPVTMGTGVTAIWFNSNPDQLQVNISPTANTDNLYMNLQVDINGTTKTREYNLVVRDPLEMIFILDRSGSMECQEGDNSVDNWDACRTTAPNRRWDKLIQAINTFKGKIGTNERLNDDRYAVAYFSGIASEDPPFNLAGLDNLATFSTFNSNIQANMSSSNVSNPRLGIDGTSMGSGFQEGLTRFSGTVANKRRVIVFCTDGEQNQAPLLALDASNNLFIDANGDGNRNPGETSFADPSISDIEVFAVGVGPFAGTASMSNLLDEIKTSPHNLYLVAAGTGSDILNEMSVDAFNEIFRGFSPNIIRLENQDLDVVHELIIQSNKDVGRLFFEAQFESPVAQLYNYEVSWNGDTVTDFATRVDTGPHFTNIIFDFVRLPDMNSQGEWKLLLTRPQIVVLEQVDDVNLSQSEILIGTTTSVNPEQVRLSATADDHATRMTTAIGNDQVNVGESITPSIDLFYHGLPVTDAQARVRIIKPGIDINHQLATVNVPTDSINDTDPEKGGCSSQKYSYLYRNNPGIIEQLGNVQETVLPLIHQGGGKYSAMYDDIDTSGVYKLIFETEVDIPGEGRLERTQELSLNVRFGKILLSISNPTKIISTDNGTTYATLSFKPAYSVGNKTAYAGPGMPWAIRATGSGVTTTNVSEDCSGGYTISVTLADGPDTDITINFFEDEVYSGPANKFDKTVPWGASIHLGFTFPQNTLDSLYDGSLAIEADLSYQVSNNLWIEGILGYYGFRNNFNIVGASLYAKAIVPSATSGFTLQGAIGGGIYKPSDFGWTGGVSGRLSIFQWLGKSQRVALGLEGSYTILPEPDYRFGMLAAGLKFRL